MERSQLFDLMGELKLYGMKAAFDEIMATAVKRQHEPQRIVGDLLNAEINEKQARSIKYQLTIAKLPLAKDLDDFQFEGTPINETLVNDLAGGGFIAQQRNAVLVGGTGTGKTHLAIAIARSCIRSGSRGRFYNVVDLVNRLEIETRILNLPTSTTIQPNGQNTNKYYLGGSSTSGSTAFKNFKVMDDSSAMIGDLEESILDGSAFYMNRTLWALLRT